MAYLDNEVSKFAGEPKELYTFKGTYRDYLYTSHTSAVLIDGKTYDPIAIQRSEVNAGTQDDDGLELTIDLPVDKLVVQDYAFDTSPPDLDLIIERYHTPEDRVRYWSGRVNNINIDGGVATLNSPSELASAMQQQFPNVYYQGPCNHVLYDARCKVSYDDFSHEGEVTAIGFKTITIDAIGTLDGKLVGGEAVAASGERRMIVDQIGEVLTINFPFSRATVGMSLTIAAGCDYSFTGDCKLKFANQLNFGGFPFVPNSNPFEDGIEEGSKLADNTCLPNVVNKDRVRLVVAGEPNSIEPIAASIKPSDRNNYISIPIPGERYDGPNGPLLFTVNGTPSDFTIVFAKDMPTGYWAMSFVSQYDPYPNATVDYTNNDGVSQQVFNGLIGGNGVTDFGWNS